MTATNERRLPEQDYLVLSKRCVFGAAGETVTLSLTPGEELSMLEAGVLEKARPTKAADKEGK